MSTQRYTVGNYLVDRLHEIGVNHLFAIPGDYCAEWVHDYVEPSAIERIGPTNELNAAYAADGYARINGIGAVCVTYSVGAFSALNAIAGSYTERVPVVLLNGAPSTAKRLQFAQSGFRWHHLINGETDLQVYRPVTVAAEQLTNAELIPGQVDRALAACLTERRPVYLEMNEDMYDMECARPVGRIKAAPIVSDPTSLENAVNTVVARLKAAKNPVVWAGIEIERYSLQERLANLLDQLQIPLVTSLLGKGVLPENLAQFVGVFDGNGSLPGVQAIFRDADYVLTLGAWLTDENTLGWSFDGDTTTFANDGSVRTGVDYLPQVFLGDLIAGISAKGQGLGPYPIPERPTRTPPKVSPDDALTYQGFYDAVTRYIDASAVVCGGTGFNFFGSLLLPIDTPSHFVSQASYADIGYVTPAAIGAALAAKVGDRVWVFAGDGGFQMTAQCISTMARLELDPIIFVLDNGVYGIEQWLADPSVYKTDAPFYPLSQLHRWNYSKLADVFGGEGWKVSTYAELEAAVEGALANTSGPSLIQVCVPEKSIPALAEFKVEAAKSTG